MPLRGVSVVVLSQDKNAVLLQKRADLRTWNLPGGRIEPGEPPADAALREVREETGYEIAIDRFVGEYRGGRAADAITFAFVAHIVGGAPIERGAETMGVAWYPVASLPRFFYRLHRPYSVISETSSAGITRCWAVCS